MLLLHAFITRYVDFDSMVFQLLASFFKYLVFFFPHLHDTCRPKWSNSSFWKPYEKCFSFFFFFLFPPWMSRAGKLWGASCLRFDWENNYFEVIHYLIKWKLDLGRNFQRIISLIKSHCYKKMHACMQAFVKLMVLFYLKSFS